MSGPNNKEAPFERFRSLAKKLTAVPKSETTSRKESRPDKPKNAPA